MGYVRHDEIRSLDEIANHAPIVRRGQFIGHLLRKHGGHAVFDWTHTTNALGDMLRVERIAAPEDRFKTAEHFPGDFCTGDPV